MIPSRHHEGQHCGDEEQRRHVAQQVTQATGASQRLDCHDPGMHGARPHREPEKAEVFERMAGCAENGGCSIMALGSDMDQSRLQRNVKVLWAMLLLAAIYGSLVRFWFATSGNDRLIGSIGVLLGLYICSQPAANAVDLLFFQRGAVRRLSKEWSGIGWLALNALVLLVGWLVIVIGTTRLTGHPSL